MSRIVNSKIFLKIALMTMLILNSFTILYILATKILYIICLDFIKDQYIIFALFIALIKYIIQPIFNDIFLLFINKNFIKPISCNIF